MLKTVASKKRYAWVVGSALTRVRPIKMVRGNLHKVAFANPTPAQEEQQCDRCHGCRHRKTNTLCTAGSDGAQSPFVLPSELYCIETGRPVGRIQFVDVAAKKKSLSGTAVASIMLY